MTRRPQLDDAATHGMLLLVVAIWGVSWVGGRVVATGLPEATGAWMRYAIASPLLLLYVHRNTRHEGAVGSAHRLRLPERCDLPELLLIAFFSTLLYQLLFMHGMHRTAAGDASLIITLNPIFTAILAIPLLGRPMTRRLALGLSLGAAGVAVVTGWSPNSDIDAAERIAGDLLIMFAALSWAASTNLVKRLLERPRQRLRAAPDPLSIIVWSSLFGWLMLTPFALAETVQNGIPMPTSQEWLWVFFLAIPSTVFSYVWFVRGVDRLGATAAATYVFLVPPFGIVAGWLLIGERLGWSLLIGFTLIVLGVRIAQSEASEVAG